MSSKPSAPTNNFIRDIIDEDLEEGRYDEVITRFPPEPNGYLHIGHAKSIVLNFGLAQDYEGRCHLRFDDTNPLTEDTEYVESIKEDVSWLGYDWGDHLYFASDFFPEMYELAKYLIREGKAYVDSLDEEQIREYRGDWNEPGEPSPYRDRSVQENLDLFERMKAGEFDDGEHVLRAKIDMEADNVLMRDPVLYRIINADHHRTEGDWCIYPMYDYAHCLEDALEGVTHSFCTLEFENNRDIYNWVLENVYDKVLEIGSEAVLEERTPEMRPYQREFARLNLGYTVMSKTKLGRLVEEGYVDGWDDPRLPTISGLRRRGVPPAAIREFIRKAGVARKENTIEIAMLEHEIRDELNMKAPRVQCVHDPLKVVITNYREDEEEWLDAPYYPHDVPKEGTRKIPFTREIYVERDDFREDPPDGYYRLYPGQEVRLRWGYFITCEDVIKDDDGNIEELRCTYDPATKGGEAPDDRDVGGVLHWVSATHAEDVELRLYDRLFEERRPDRGDGDFIENLYDDSLVVNKDAKIEPSVTDDDRERRYQFERQGYYRRDLEDSTEDNPVFNRIVPLRDSWKKRELEKQKERERQRHLEKKRQRQKAKSSSSNKDKKPASYERDKRREKHPELAERLDSYQEQLGLEYDEADLLSGDKDKASFFDAAREGHDDPARLAKWIVNELLPEVDDDQKLDELPIESGSIAKLETLFDDGEITNTASRQTLEIMLEEGGDPEVIIEREGLEKVEDESQLQSIVEEVLERYSDEAERFKDGEMKLMGFFIGKVMEETDRTADPEKTREILQEVGMGN